MGKSYLIVKACLLILVLFAMEANSTLYSVSPDFKVSFQKAHSELAHAFYRQQSLSTGWNYLHVYANAQVSLLDQHRGAGFLEGYVSYRQIYFAYKNLMASIIKAPTLSLKAEQFINDQLDYIDNIVENHENQLFRIYAQAYMEQLRFMHRGYLTRINQENQLGYYLGFTEFYYLTNVGDLQDLIPAFKITQSTEQQKINQKQTTNHNLQKQKLGNCNAIAKIIDNKIVVGHSTHNIYQFLLRIYKTYSFPSRDPRVGSQWYSFSSRPGDLISKDDFYVLSNGMIVMETSLGNYNDENYKTLTPKTLPCWLRQCVAVNLARNNDEWAEYFLKYRSGTHNNQWVIINPNNLANKKDLVIFVEQAFDMFRVSDMTQTFLTQGYIATYNMPYNDKIRQKLGTPGNYENDPRAVEYKQLFPQLNDQQDFKTLLLQNKNQDPRSGIAPRYDLAQQGAIPFGLTDLKVYSPNTLANNFIWAYSGPTWSSKSEDKLPPFDWSKWSSYSHQGMAQVWNFNFQKHFIDYEKVANGKIDEKVVDS